MFTALVLVCVLGTSDCIPVVSDPVSTPGECWLLATVIEPFAISAGIKAYPGALLGVTTICQKSQEA